MPLQNRVTPWGEIVALPQRGLFMGNRDCLHDGQRHVVKKWARVPWVTCLVEFQGRHRGVMTPGQYTELFFLDEATALAAGHRPCATCRRADYDRFKALWVAANPDLAGTTNGTMEAIDRLLHAERVDAGGCKRTWTARLGELPDGVMVVRDGADEVLLRHAGGAYPWTPAGYGPRQVLPQDTMVRVLTPRSVAKVLARGYRPVLHPSVDAPVEVPVAAPSTRPGSAATAPGSSEVRSAPEPRLPEAPAVPPRAVVARPSDDRPQTGGAQLYRLERTPAGRALFTYFAAVLIATGMDRGAVYPLKKFLGNFSGHEQAGRIEKAAGGHRLTDAGREYFADRFRAGNAQYVDRGEVDAMVRLIRSGQAPGWVPVA